MMMQLARVYWVGRVAAVTLAGQQLARCSRDVWSALLIGVCTERCPFSLLCHVTQARRRRRVAPRS